MPAPSKNYDPEGAGGLDIDINPISRSLIFADQQEPNQRYIVKLQLHQHGSWLMYSRPQTGVGNRP